MILKILITSTLLFHTAFILAQNKPKLHVLSIGVSVFENEDIPFEELSYADKDAKDIAQVLKTQKDLYDNGYFFTLTDDDAPLDKIEQTFELLGGKIHPNDLFVFFFSGHGVPGYLLPYDYDDQNPTSTGLAHSYIKKSLSQLGCNYVVLLDACHSASFTGESSKGSLAIVADEVANVYADVDKTHIVMTSSASNAFSIESDEHENGYFTQALLNCFENIAEKDMYPDANQDGLVDYLELADYVQKWVAEKAGQRAIPAMKGGVRLPFIYLKNITPTNNKQLPSWENTSNTASYSNNSHTNLSENKPDPNSSSNSMPNDWVSRSGNSTVTTPKMSQEDLNSNLLEAASRGDLPQVEFFLKEGAQLNAKNKEWKTSLDIAFTKGRTQVVDFLLQKGATCTQEMAQTWLNANAWNTLVLAGKHQEMGNWDLEYLPAKQRIPLLLIAVRANQLPLLEALLDGGANVNIKDRYNNTALHWACAGGHTAIVQLLLTKWVNIHAQNNDGYTPLMLTTTKGNAEIFSMLLQKGANLLDERSVSGKLESIPSIAIEKGHGNIVKLLLAEGVSFKISDLETAIKNGYHTVVESLLPILPTTASQIDGWFLESVKKGHKLVAEQLLSKQANINQVDLAGYTPLMYAAKNNDRTMVQFLMDKGANKNIKRLNPETNTMETAALMTTDKEISTFIKNYW